MYKNEKCAFSQMHTPLITKIQVYIFVVCCCLIFFPLRHKVRYNFSKQKLNLYKQSIINVKFKRIFYNHLKIMALQIVYFNENSYFLPFI